MEIRPVDVEDDTEFAAFHAIRDAAEAYERPWSSRRTLDQLRIEFTDEDPAEKVVGVVAEDEGEIVGAGVAYFFLTENLHLAHVMPWVAPERRRRGIGTAVLDHLVELAAAAGRTEVVAECGYPFERREDHGHRRFAEVNGFSLANTEIRRVLDLPVDPGLLTELVARAAPHHEGYRILTFDDASTVPDDLVPSLCHTKDQLGADAPTGDIDYEAEHTTPEMYRHRCEVRARLGWQMVTTLAVSPEGEAVAYNDLVIMGESNPYVSQWGTLVRADHRGHRLGLAVKAAGLARLQELIDVRDRAVQTCNAEQNAQMVGINVDLGFRPVEVCPAFLRRLEPVG